jgi:hypothetical protein
MDISRVGGTKKKWFQVTRFPALLSAGMHGIEHCIGEVLGASPFRSPKADFSTPGSMPSGSPQSFFPMEPVSRSGLSLARNGCSLSEASIPGSMALACYFETSRLVPPPGPPLAPLPPLVCPS